MDLSQLSNDDLLALRAGDLSKVSTAGLQALRGGSAYQEGRNMATSPGKAALQGLHSVMQGPTFGFYDEIGGALSGLKSLVTGGDFKKSYRDTRDYLRGAADAQAQENPITSAITRGMAAAPTMLFQPFAGAAPASLIGRAGLAGAQGAVGGALSAAGESKAETLGGVAGDTAMGAALGGALGGTVPLLTAAGGGVGRNVAARFSQNSADKFAREKVAEAFLRDAPNGLENNAAAAFGRADARLARLGDEARVVDSGGQNVRQLLDTVAMLPGQTKNATEAAIRQRVSGRADRLIDAANSGMRTNKDRLADVVDDMVIRKSQDAAPLYGQLHKMGVQGDDELFALVKAAESVGADKQAKMIAAANQKPYSLSSGAVDQNTGSVAMRDLDHLKQGLDTLIANAYGKDGNLTPVGFSLTKLRERLISKLDETTGGFYAQARAAYAGPAALQDAATTGRRMFSDDSVRIGNALEKMTTSEQDAFRVGAFEALRSKLASPNGQTEVLGMWKNKGLQEKLKAVFPDERAFREFAASAAGEARLKGLESVGRGSQTAARQYAAGDLDMPAVRDVASAVTSAATGNAPGFLSSAMSAWNRVQTPEPVRDQMGRILLGKGGLLGLRDTLEEVAQSRARNAGLLGMGTGTWAGGLLN